ncbi:MAG: S-layer homology domain-containing protein [Faecousia sp.]
MNRFIKRILSVFLLLAVLTACLLPAEAATGSKIANPGQRDVVCTALSAQAEAYYTDAYTYEQMKELDGAQNTTDSYAATQNNPLYQTLYTLMSSTQTEYYSYSSLSKDFAYTDTQNGVYDGTMSCLWAGRTAVWNGNYFNREHVWPKSRASFYQINGGADRHHLRPVSATINQDSHINRPYGTATGGTLAYDEVGNLGGRYTAAYFEPNDNVKGDTARILLYIYVRWQQPNLYSDVKKENLPALDSDDVNNGGDNGLKVIESLDTLLAWCELDPVDTWEMGRNDAIERIQGNRNVFIDYPELAWLLFGKAIPTDMTTPSGEAKNSAPQYTVTARSNNDAFGTVSQNDRTITATPENGYMVSGYEVSPAGAATVTQSGNTFTVSKVKADCTVTIIFAPKPVATITYIVPNGVTVSGTTTCYVGDTVTLAAANGTPTEGEGYTFFGWSPAEIIDTAVQPSVQKAGASYTVKAAQTTFYGVFTYLDGTIPHYISNPCKHEFTHLETIAPTCVQDGAENIVCDACGAIRFSTPIAKTGHDYVDTVVDPNCNNKGYTLHTCKTCGESYKNTYTAALGHEYVSKVTKPATATEDGVLTYTCTRCDSSYTGVIPATGEDKPTVHDCPSDAYSDLDKTEWYHKGVDLMLEMGYMNGVGNGRFDPSGTTTRAMIVTILWRIAGEPVPETENTFSDVAAGQWYTDAITWAAENDVVNGVGDGKFDPDGKITREQMATILFRYAGSLGADTSKRAELSGFSDGGKTADWATDAVQWAVAEGIINGSEGKLLPQDSATRAQVATILYRAMELITE